MNSTVTIIAWLLFFAQPQTPSVLERQFERRAVTSVRQILAFKLDAELPSLSFADWFKQVVGPRTGIVWQLSECGEPQEAPSATRDIRACVEVNTILPDSRLVLLRIAVGTFKKGVAGAPTFYFGVVAREGELYQVLRLRDLPKLLWTPGGLASKPAVTLPGISMPKVELAANNIYLIVAPAWSGEEFGQLMPDEEPPPEPPPLDSVAPSKPPSPTEGRSAPGRLIQGAALYKAQPTYPPNAKGFNATGHVEVRVTISEAGRVKEAVAVSGHPLLRDAAVEAARKWVFRPTTVDGVPTETRLVLTFDFPAPTR